MDYVKHNPITLKGHPDFNELWLCDRIAEDTSILGLGEIDFRDRERIQPGAGRLDLLFSTSDATTRFEVEVQLGRTDESHKIRTIEYWDIERNRYPQYEHVAVIVAEDITSRFLNVISLFNRSIPLIAIQVNAVEIDGSIALVFTTVLDLTVIGNDEDEEFNEPKDRAYWEEKATPENLDLTDDLFNLVKEIQPKANLKYNKNYIGIALNGVARNFVAFRPKKQLVQMEFKIPRSDALDKKVSDAGLNLLSYSRIWGLYRVQITQSDLFERKDILLELIQLASDTYFDD